MADHFTSEGDLYMRTDPDRVVPLTDRDRGAHVEIIDPTGDQRILVPTIVRVNGVDVGLLAKDGIQVDAGSIEEATKVTLVLLASTVEIKSEDRAAVDLEAAVESAKQDCINASMRLADAQRALHGPVRAWGGDVITREPVA